VSSAGQEALDLAESVGLIGDPWQNWSVDQILSEDADGDWCNYENVVITGRQSGKNFILMVVELAGLFLFGDPKIIHSAHEVPTSLAHFLWFKEIIDSSPDLSRKCKLPVNTNGKEAIRLSSGPRLEFRARGINSGRGLTAKRLILDEAFDISPSSVGALQPTLRAVKNPQIIYASSAPKKTSIVLHSLIERGRKGDPDDRLFYAEWGNPVGTPLDDEEAWKQANPALGTRITIETLRDEYRTQVSGGMPELMSEFSREAVGIGEPLPKDESRVIKMDSDEWGRTRSPGISPPVGHLVLAYDVDLDGQFSSISVAAGNASNLYTELVEHRPGVGWLAGRLVELVSDWSPVAVGYNAAGPALEQFGSVNLAFQEADVDVRLLKPLGMADYRAACGHFLSSVKEGTLRRPADQAPLDDAGGDASERPLGEGWVWHRRQATVPISPLVACTVACFLVDSEPPLVEETSELIVVE